MSRYVFGATSERNLVGVRAELVDVTRLALERSPFDFGVVCGVRSFDQQVKHVQDGRSDTLKLAR